jgi:hypothetical protein
MKILNSVPHVLKREIRRICRRYRVENTAAALVEYIREHNAADYDQEYADDMEEAYNRYLARRGR